MARVKAVLRRAGARRRRAAVLQFADLELDEQLHEVRRAGQRIELSPTEFKLLRYFLRNPRIVLSKAQILDHVWEYDFGGDANVVETYISYLRRKLDTGGAAADPDRAGRRLRPARRRVARVAARPPRARHARPSRWSLSSWPAWPCGAWSIATSTTGSTSSCASLRVAGDDAPCSRALAPGGVAVRPRRRPVSTPRRVTRTATWSSAGSCSDPAEPRQHPGPAGHRSTRARSARRSTPAAPATGTRSATACWSRRPAAARRRHGRRACSCSAIPTTDADATLRRLVLGRGRDRRGGRACWPPGWRGGWPASGCGPCGASRTPRPPSPPAICPSRVDPGTKATEIVELGSSLNTMLGRIETAFDAKDASEARLRRFVADASHELRTPLTSIRGYAELFRRGAADDPATLRRSMERIEGEAIRMGGLVDDLLLLARLDEGRPLERVPVDLTALAADAVHDAAAADPDRPVALDAPRAGRGRRRPRPPHPGAREPARQRPHAHAAGHAGRRRGARRERPGRGGRGRPRSGHPRRPEAARVRPLPPHRPVAHRETAVAPGSGLAIVDAVVRAHGGSVDVGDTPGGGATFTVRLPRRAARQDTAPSQAG